MKRNSPTNLFYIFKVKNRLCHLKKKKKNIKFQFLILILRIVFYVKGRFLQIFNNKYSFSRSLGFFENEIFATQTRSEICGFFGIDLIKIKPMKSDVPIF